MQKTDVFDNILDLTVKRHHEKGSVQALGMKSYFIFNINHI